MTILCNQCGYETDYIPDLLWHAWNVHRSKPGVVTLPRPLGEYVREITATLDDGGGA